MTITILELIIYAGAVAILFLSPGPVWLALGARTLAGGFGAAWPLVLGVVIGDAVWPFLAILGVSWIVSVFAGFMIVLRGLATVIFVVMGALIIRNAGATITTDSRLTRPGAWAGFAAGLAVILSNPKAIVFYMGVLPGFFDLTGLSTRDIAAIVAVSMAVPLIGNIILALFLDRARRLLSSPKALRRTSIVSGAMLILVGLIIPFT
ncbi:MAG: LysE family translocator [Paracoccaceae bacterium]